MWLFDVCRQNLDIYSILTTLAKHVRLIFTNLQIWIYVAINHSSTKYDYSRFQFVLLQSQITVTGKNERLNINISKCLVSN